MSGWAGRALSSRPQQPEHSLGETGRPHVNSVGDGHTEWLRHCRLGKEVSPQVAMLCL